MSKQEQQKAALASQTLNQFFNQFGDDIYAQILLEELFKGLMDEEALFISGKQKQTGDQTNHGFTKQPNSEQQNYRSERIEPPHGLGEENYPDYP